MGVKIGKHSRRSPEINIVPFVDILLVLLIVFMVASPVLVSGISIDLPKAKSPATPEVEKKNITISITNNGKFFFNDNECPKNQLLQRFKAIAKPENAVIFVRGDRKIKYSEIMDVVNIATIAGFENVVLVTDDS